MTIREQIHAYRSVIPGIRKADKLDLLTWLRHRPKLLLGYSAYETALLMSGRMNARLKSLAELKAAALVNCEFCIDVGSHLARVAGVTDAQLTALPRFRESDAFDADEKLVLEFAEAVSSTPALVSEELRQKLVDRFSARSVTELAAAIAWENSRGRLNQALGVRPAGFSEGAVCAVPEQSARGAA